MTEEKFHEICKKIIIPLGESMKKNLGAEFNFFEKQTYIEYQRQKTLFRHLCNKNVYDCKVENLLDRHKVCAAICVSLLNSNPIYIPNEKFKDSQLNLGEGTKLNEQLAIASSLCLLRSFLELEYEEQGKQSLFSKNLNFIFPSPHQGEEEYIDALVRTVYFARLCGQLNLYLLAHIFFLIEQYHIINVKNQ